jgi:hypothetical protein
MTSSRDFPDERVLVNTLQFTPQDIAVLDVRRDFATVNWTTSCSQIQFYAQAMELSQFRVDTISLRYNGNSLEVDRSEFEKLTTRSGEFFEKACDFIRIDITSSRSFAWQRLSADGPDVVGFGDSSANIAVRKKPVLGLLEATASRGVDIRAVMAELDRLLQTLPGIFPPKP